MKLITSLFLLAIVLGSTCAYAQKFRIVSPPIDGYFYMDTVCDPSKPLPSYTGKCVDIICENNTVYASGIGKVIFCYSHGNRTYEIGIKYEHTMIVYNNIKKKTVQRSQPVKEHTMIGELPLNPKDKLYHLGLQVVEAPNRLLWYKPFVSYLNAQLVAN